MHDTATRLAVADRSCGACRACCKLPEIPEFGKPANVWCQHANPSPDGPGCRIYNERPEGCRRFACGWMQGIGGPDDRPDKLGVMWQRVTLGDGREGIAAVEMTPRALESPRVQAYLRQFMRTRPGRVAIRRAEETHFRRATLTVSAPPRSSTIDFLKRAGTNAGTAAGLPG